ncbi:MAG TPA: GNAT family N-acetyltransferase [Vineibacter sp.]|nr:GNAT family N-acetyltransferase [Vineibacter sp.]
MARIPIRPATPADAETISTLIQQAVRRGNAADYEPEIIDRICANFSRGMIVRRMAEREVFVGEVDGQIAGTVSLRGDKLYSLFVAVDRHGQGIGRHLVNHLEAHALGRGVGALRLSAALGARLFYERLGYRALAFEPRDDGSTWLMFKELDTAGQVMPGKVF